MSEVEAKARALCAAGDVRAAATLVLETYGPEVLGWLRATTEDRVLADDAFAAAAEDVWRGLPSFRGDASLRTWTYVLARHALARHRKEAARGRKQAPLSDASAVVERVRSQTAPWQRTDVKDRFVALRSALEESDRSLLVLRVDRDLPWEEIAVIVAAEGEDLKRVSARLRQRFKTIKETLRTHARREGLLAGDD